MSLRRYRESAPIAKPSGACTSPVTCARTLARPSDAAALDGRAPLLSGVAGSVGQDMIMLMMNKSSWHGLGTAVAGLGIGIYAPDSRGRVTLAAADPRAPVRSFDLLGDGQ